MGKNGHTPSTIKPLSKTAAACAVFIATIVLSLLSFISMELAMLTFGVMTLAAVLYFENRRRAFWELGASFKFRLMRDIQKTHSQDLMRTGLEIESLKQDMRDTKVALRRMHSDAPASKAETPAAPPPPQAPPPPSPALMEFLRQEKLTRRPKPEVQPQSDYSNLRAWRPGQEEKIQEPVIEARIEDYEGLSDTVVKELLSHAVMNKRVDVFVQPIMRLPQRQTRFYEVFARIRARPGQYLPASRYRPVAEQDHLQNDIDILLLGQCLQTLEKSAHIERAAPFFINVSSSTLKDTAFMKKLLGFLAQNRDLAPRLILEMAQKDFESMPQGVREIIRGIGKLGCSFSLDHIAQYEFDVAEMQRYKIRYAKIDAHSIRGQRASEKNFVELQRAKRVLEANGIGVIVERIEDEHTLRGMLDLDIHYGQGYLFGKPELQGAYASRARIRRLGDGEQKAKA